MNVGIVSAATGNGHISVARAIGNRLMEKGAQVSIRERFYEELMLSNKVMSDYYNFLLQSSTELCCKFSELSYLTRPDLSEDFYQGTRESIVQYLSSHPLDAIVSTSHTINHAMLRVMKELGIDRTLPYYIVVTDPFVPISVGFDAPGADRYYCTGKAVVAFLRKRGIEEERIKEIAYPVQPQFLESYPPNEIASLCEQKGLRQGEPIVLINSGSQGAYHTLEFLKTVLRQVPECQVVFVSGRNDTLYTMAQRVASAARDRVKVIGYAEHLEQWIQLADAIITKPGANAFFECTYARKPMLLDAVNGFLFQEKGVKAWLGSNSAVSVVEHVDELAPRLKEMLQQLRLGFLPPALHADMPEGAQAIAQDIWSRFTMRERVNVHDY
ncbi:MGDG synthase family glycosyltransferase [Paenibacillus massiliensis]|uniref:MGDG synthase family glycosyltransferase n=1 Tax=Paenibacillus massiliensis TaxID=225917 RepID=UPI000471D55E|nr:glycosyltransferase [Paenibacillus massiliensis]